MATHETVQFGNLALQCRSAAWRGSSIGELKHTTAGHHPEYEPPDETKSFDEPNKILNFEF